MRERVVSVLDRRLWPEQRLRLRRWRRRLLKPARLGTLRNTSPLSDSWGWDRGLPIDRYYIERFLARHRSDIHGRVLEIRDNSYTCRFGSGVRQSDVLDIEPTNHRATIVTDLARADTVPDDRFDCFILTQTLQYVFDVRSAIRHSRRILRPGGVLLATVPSIIRMERHGPERDYWRFTVPSCLRLFGDVFGTEQISVRPYGNMLVAVAFLAGMAREELSQRELNTVNPAYPIVVCIRAVKRG